LSSDQLVISYFYEIQAHPPQMATAGQKLKDKQMMALKLSGKGITSTDNIKLI